MDRVFKSRKERKLASQFNLTSKVNYLFFLCAVLSGNRDLIVTIARCNPENHHPEYEYEDDFLNYLVFQKLALSFYSSDKFDFESAFEDGKLS